MLSTYRIISLAGAITIGCGIGEAMAQCSVPPLYFSGGSAELEGTMTVTAGKSCRFLLNGIPGAIEEVQIVQQPKIGRAGVQGLYPYYIAKPGYTGPDEFAYAYTGKDRYGGPMRVVFKRKVTVVP